MQSTAGQLLINEVLPEDLRDYHRPITKKSLGSLLSELAMKHPDQYRDVSFKLGQIGRIAAYRTGGQSFGLRHLKQAVTAKHRRAELQEKIDELLDRDDVDEQQLNDELIKLTGRLQATQQEEIFQESKAEDNPLAHQLEGAGRGNKMTLASMRGSDLLYQDYKNNIIPVPVMRSYSQGLSPLEYWAGTYGARRGVISTKLATADSGFLGKQLAQITHRLLVTDDDEEGEPTTLRGLPVDVTDSDSEGSLLAHPVAGYARNTILTPKILRDIENKGFKKILVRSPAVSGSPDGGIYAKDAGIREFNRLPVRHEAIGLSAAQSLTEPLTQSALSEKHSGGVASGQRQNLTGFARINQLIQVPKTFKGGAAHATIDGIVQSVEPAPAGGHFISVNGTKHYVAKGFEPTVKRGDTVEAGDVLSDGEPSPALITQYKGVGEGRKYFVDIFQKAMRDSGLKSHRRNVELLARGLINHVRMSEEYGNYAPDDVVPYSTLERNYEPRPGFRSVTPSEAVGKYLERPYLHYSIGTKIRPSMLANMREFGIRNVDVHDDPPPFEPEMIRGMSNLQHDPDWMVRLFGSGLKSSLTKAVHRGATSDESGTSFVPSRARAVDFGLSGAVQTPKPPKPTSLES
jgi:DNA-directed RNA polymerase subunit beta'